MAGERGWSEVSFTPEGKKRVLFGEVGVTFPAREHIFEDSPQPVDPEDVLGPITIRIQSSNIGALPTFPKGEKGTFQGTRPEDGVMYFAVNATVIDSKRGDLTLESESLDKTTSPIGIALA